MKNERGEPEKSRKIFFVVGLMEYKEIKAPFFSIDFGKNEPSYLESLRKNDVFHLGFRPKSKKVFTYYIIGDKTEKNGEGIEEPCFSASFSVTAISHLTIQSLLKKSQFWGLIVKSSTKVCISIENKTGKIKEIFEKTR